MTDVAKSNRAEHTICVSRWAFESLRLDNGCFGVDDRCSVAFALKNDVSGPEYADDVAEQHLQMRGDEAEGDELEQWPNWRGQRDDIYR